MDTDPKISKKTAKAAVKTAKKQNQPTAVHRPSKDSEDSPAARSAAAAERQVVLTRWRVVLGLLAVIVALITMFLTLWK